MIRRLYAALANWAVCSNCGFWGDAGHTCHPADR